MFAIKQRPSAALLFLVARHRWHAHHDIVSRVVQASKNTADRNEKRGPGPRNVHAMISYKWHPLYHQMERHNVVEFPQEKFKRMDVHGIDVRTGGCLLVVVMFVNKCVYCFHVEKPVEERVKKVVGDEEYWNWKNGIYKRQFFQLPHTLPTAAAMVVSAQSVFFVLVIMVMIVMVFVFMMMVVIMFMHSFQPNTP